MFWSTYTPFDGSPPQIGAICPPQKSENRAFIVVLLSPVVLSSSACSAAVSGRSPSPTGDGGGGGDGEYEILTSVKSGNDQLGNAQKVVRFHSVLFLKVTEKLDVFEFSGGSDVFE